MKNVESKSAEEEYEQIRENLGIEPVRIMLTNEQMNYQECEIDSELRTAFILYEYEGQMMSYIINCTYTEDTWGIGFEEEKVDEYVYGEDVSPIQVEQYVVKDSEEDQWIATFEYQGVYYSLVGRMEQGKFEEILNKLFFP